MYTSVRALALATLLSFAAVTSWAQDPPPADSDPTLLGDQARAVKETVKQNAKQVAEAAREGATQAAATAKGVAQDVASSAKEGAQQVAATTRKGARKVRATVSGDKTPAAPAPDKPATP